MSNVVPLFKALPEPAGDARISALYSAFGRRPFSISQAVDVLDISYDEARHILFAHPLCDGRFRVSPYSLGFWLLPTGPHERAAQTWQSQYAPVVKELCRNQTSFSGVDFAKKAAVPFSSAQYILSMLVKNGLLTIQALENGGAATFSLNRKRRRVIRAY